jgi:hypothetical protein
LPSMVGQLAQEHLDQVETEWVGQNTPESTLIYRRRPSQLSCPR